MLAERPSGAPRQERDRLEYRQGVWLCAASALASAASLGYVLLCRFAGNRGGHDPSGRRPPSWLSQQTTIYGGRFLFFLSSVNLIYGVTTSWFVYFNSYYLSRGLKLSPAEMQTANGTINLCIIIRPLLGFISDSVPICGSTRSSYFFIAALGSAGCYLALASLAPLTQIPVGVAVLLLCAANVLGYAWCGVLLYAIVATEQRREPVSGAAQLNAIQWGFYSGGALMGDLTEGVVLQALGAPHRGYWLCCVLWLCMAVCGFFYEEGRPIAPPPEGSSLQSSLVPEPDDWDSPPSSWRPSSTDSSQGLSEADGNGQDEPDAEGGGDGGFRQQMHKLWVTLDPRGPTKGVVVSAVAYIFLTWAVIPDVGTGATYYFYTGKERDGGLAFGDVTYSMLSVVGDIAMLGASYIYGAYLGDTPLRKLFIGLQLLNVAASALDLALALHWNERIGVSAAAFAAVDSAVYFLAWQLKNLPVYTLAAKVCPPGVEASLTACIAGMNDLSGSVAQYLGAALTSFCGVTSSDFRRIWILYLIRTACKLIPIPLVLLVPSEARLREALRDVRRSFAAMERAERG